MPTDLPFPRNLPVHVTPAAMDDDRPEVLAWRTHVDAGRIGTRPALAPDILANLEVTDALFRSFRRGHRA